MVDFYFESPRSAKIAKNRSGQRNWFSDARSQPSWAGFYFDLVGLERENPQNQSQLGTFLYHFRTILPNPRKLLDGFQRYWYRFTRHFKRYRMNTTAVQNKEVLNFFDFSIPDSLVPSKFQKRQMFSNHF